MTVDEFNQLEVGSVVLFGKKKTERIVRKVSINRSERSIYCGKKFYIYFVIKNCSWTGRCYTLYTLHDVMRLCEFTGIVVEIPEWQQLVFNQEVNSSKPARITCCDVKGYS